MSDAKLYTCDCDRMHVLGTRRPTMTFDLSDYKAVRFTAGGAFVETTPERFVACMAWLLSCVDTDTLITKDGVEVDA
jgi:hypothetical protein